MCQSVVGTARRNADSPRRARGVVAASELFERHFAKTSHSWVTSCDLHPIPAAKLLGSHCCSGRGACASLSPATRKLRRDAATGPANKGWCCSPRLFEIKPAYGFALARINCLFSDHGGLPGPQPVETSGVDFSRPPVAISMSSSSLTPESK